LSSEEPTRYCLWSSAVAIAAALPVVAAAATEAVLPWTALGWFLGMAPGVAGGTALVRTHGTPSADFVKILGASMLVRLIVFPAGALLAIGSGRVAASAYAFGLLAGYLPTQIFEGAWFYYRSSKSVACLTVTASDRLGVDRG